MAKSASIIVVTVASLLIGIEALWAQVPPHKPGSVCIVSDQSWCWADTPGQPGARCSCPVPGGSREGRLA